MTQNELEKALYRGYQVAQGYGLKLANRLVDWTPGTASDPYFRHVYYLDLTPGPLDTSGQVKPGVFDRPASSWALGWRATYVDGKVSGEGSCSLWELPEPPARASYTLFEPLELPDCEVKPWLEAWVRTIDAARRLSGEADPDARARFQREYLGQWPHKSSMSQWAAPGVPRKP